jgi:endonuclease/exonuclease/phosphatase family metal-dependent hydrolase
LDQSQLLPIVPHAFAGNRWEPAGAPGGARAPAPVTLLTWNVWFGRHKLAARTAALLDEISWRTPEVIALQEVTEPSLALVLAHPAIRARYHLSDVSGQTFDRYGVVLLSSIPFRSLAILPLPSEMGRRLLIGTLANGLTVATIHLESTAECAAERAAQLRIIQPALAGLAEDYVLVGDMNFSPDAVLENQALLPELVDSWPALHPSLPGYTVDSSRNAMRQRVDPDPVARRIDRVFVRGQRWRAESIALTGVTPIDSSGTFVSDHFGLEAVLAPLQAAGEWFAVA